MLEAIHFGGDTLLAFDPILNLVPLGFNDRVSSIKNFGKIY